MRIRIPDPDPGSGFRIRIPDPDPGFDDLKLKKFTPRNLISIFLIKNCNLLIPRPPERTPKLQKKTSALKSEHPVLQKMKILSFFLFFGAISPLLDPDPQFVCGSGSATLSVHLSNFHLCLGEHADCTWFYHHCSRHCSRPSQQHCSRPSQQFKQSGQMEGSFPRTCSQSISYQSTGCKL